MQHRPKHIVEYVALRGIAGVMNLLPYRAALGIGWVLAWIAFHVVGFRVKAAKARIREVFGERFNEAEVNRIAWISMRNMFFNGVEVLRMPKITRAWVESVTDRGNLDEMTVRMKSGKGAILVVPHTGNWDLAGVAAQMFDLPMFFLVGKQKNPLTDAYLNRMRGVTGIETIPRDSSILKKVIRNLRDGKILAFMTDLRSKTPAMKVQFLGKEANLVGGMALFARQAGSPIFPAIVTRVGWSRHKWQLFDPITPDPNLDKETDWQRMTQAVIDIYDRAIRAEPEQYFWYNKRWVLDPLEETSPTSEPANAQPATN